MYSNLILHIRKFIFTFLILFSTNAFSQKIIKGYIRDKNTNESIISAIVYNENNEYSVTDQNGYFELHLIKNDSIFVSSLGMKPINIKIQENITFINLYLESIISEEILIVDKRSPIKELNSISFNKNRISRLSSLAGEIDVFQALHFNAGVQHANEGQSNIVVRGGLPDQNLVMVNGVRLYNYLHLLGFIPFINGEMIKDVKFYKDNIPSKYGGRASSLIDITMFDGNTKKTELEATLGLISSKVTYKKPIIKDKWGINVGGRISNLNLIKIISESNYKKSEEGLSTGINIYDFSLSSKYMVSEKSNISIFGILSNDILSFKQKFFQQGEEINTITWKNNLVGIKYHSVYKSLFSLESGVSYLNYTNSANNILFTNQNDKVFESNLGSGVDEFNMYANLKFYFNNHFNLNSGIGFYSTLYNIFNYSDLKTAKKTPSILQNNPYFFIDANLNKNNYDLTLGIRTDVLHGKPIFQPRVSLSKKINDYIFSTSYSINNQSSFLITPLTLFSPIDFWVPANKNNPNISSQFSMGVTKEIRHNLLIGLSIFYKSQTNIADITKIYNKIDSSLSTFYDDISYSGRLKARGIESSLAYTTNKLTLNINYTFNQSQSRFIEINDNIPYNTNFLRPHSANIGINWKMTNRVFLNLKGIYSSGQPLSIPVNAFSQGSGIGLIFDKKNNGNFPDYFRLDIGLEYNKSKKSIWNFSIYNVTNRRNPFGITFEDRMEYTTYEDIVNFKIVPSLSYTYKFLVKN
jgi:hypothetical protein